MRQKNRFRKFSLFLGGALLAYIAFCFYLADTVVAPRRRVAFLPKEFVIWEPIPKVHAWASPAVAKGTAKNLFIFSHGLKANRNFFAATAKELQHRGYDVLMLPMPGHDDSPEQTLGYGIREAKLIRETIDAVKAEHIVLVGCSMGGAATWLASDHPRVDGVVTECAFGRLEPVTHVWFNRVMPYGDVVFKPVIWIASARLGLNPSDINPVETARKWDHRKPALVIQANGDILIPKEQGEELAQVSGAEYWSVPMASHADCQSCGSEYIDRIEGVMKKVIQNQR